MVFPKISVCIPTKNSEKTIETCLKSVISFANEIIILDCYSDDNTLNICRNYNTQIYQHNFIGFVNLYQELLKKATNDWIIILASDEEVSNELSEELIDNLKNIQNVCAYYVPIVNHMFGKKMHISISAAPRIGLKKVFEFSRKLVHEKLSVKQKWINNTRKLKNPIIHYSYIDISDYFSKFSQYTSLEALRLLDENRKPNLVKYIFDGLIKAIYLLFWEKGILDGYRGFMFSSMTFQYSIVTYAKYKELQKIMMENPLNWRNYWIENECQR